MRLGLALLAIVAMTTQAAGGAWPEGRKAAVVLTYDDSLSSHLDTVIPALDAAGLKGTFFLGGRWVRQEDVARWRAAASAGHELGNQTVFHPCARDTYAMPARYNSEGYSVETMLDEVRTMNAFLTAIDGKSQHAYAMPCGQRLAGGVDYVAALRASGLVRYTRDLPVAEGMPDPRILPSVWFPENAAGAEMIDAVKRAERSGSMLVFGFHGVGGNYLSVPSKAHAELVAYLKAHQSTIWVAPYSTVMDYLMAHPQ